MKKKNGKTLGKQKPSGKAEKPLREKRPERPTPTQRVELQPLASPPVPQVIDDVLCAFPARVIGTLLPEREKIPTEFKDEATSWNKFIDHWFHIGLPRDVQFHAKTGVDPALAFRHIDACMRSYEPKHQHKMSGCAYLASCFFEKVVFPSEKKEFKGP